MVRIDEAQVTQEQPLAGLPILDGDGHVIEQDQVLYEYLEAPYRRGRAVLGYPFFPTLDGHQRGAIAARLGLHETLDIDAPAWLRFLDAVGIESTVLYPTAGLSYGLIQDPEWAIALARAYNDWLHDRFYRVSPRLRGVALIPLQDVDEAVRELRRAITELQMVGAVLPATGGDLGVRKPLGHRDFWPVYEEAVRLNCPLAVHGAPSQGLGFDFFTHLMEAMALEHPFAQMIQLTSMVCEGVFERFPALRVAYLEAGTGWVPYLLDRLDRQFEIYGTDKYRRSGQVLTKPPSAYVTSGQLYFTCEADEASASYALQRLGDRVFMFASDFPHETNLERAKREVAEMLDAPDFSDEAKANILCHNVRRFYQR